MPALRRTRLVLSASLLLAAAGCSSLRGADSSTAQDYSGRPQRVAVLASMGEQVAPRYADSFRSSLVPVLGTCGVASAVVPTDGMLLARAGDAMAQARAVDAQLKPDAVLSIFPTGYARHRGFPVEVRYQAVLSEAATGRAVWQARFGLGLDGPLFGPADLGDGFAKDLVGRMARDGALRTCPKA